ncbi:hypothetical protein GmHk_15G044769 [Glycine max]|nr:hypothetical protein GmHk_15G044769 [Glycine max]
MSSHFPCTPKTPFLQPPSFSRSRAVASSPPFPPPPQRTLTVVSPSSPVYSSTSNSSPSVDNSPSPFAVVAPSPLPSRGRRGG